MFECLSMIYELFMSLQPATLFKDLIVVLAKFIALLPDAMGVLLVLAIVFFIIRLIPL